MERHFYGITWLLIVLVVLLWSCIAFAGTANLAWDDPVPSVTQAIASGHKIYRSTDATVCDNVVGVLPLYQTINVVGTSFNDVAVPDVNGKVCYEVSAFNAGGESSHSNRISKVTTVNPPPAPANLRFVP